MGYGLLGFFPTESSAHVQVIVEEEWLEPIKLMSELSAGLLHASNYCGLPKCGDIPNGVLTIISWGFPKIGAPF